MHSHWILRTRSLVLGERTLIMGIVNVTPDSFSDGRQFFAPAAAVAHAIGLLAAGADILDIGGESTRPGTARTVSAEEEKRRVLPVIEAVVKQAPHAVISVDTYKAETAAAALDAGAEIINDVSGFTWDEQMLSLLARRACGCVLMHTRGHPDEWRNLPRLGAEEVIPMVISSLRRLTQRALDAGIAKERLVLDPGFGFGKRLEENYPLLAHFADLQELGFPLLSGPSRKSFLRRMIERDGNDVACALEAATTAAVTVNILQGGQIVRVHDVASAVAAAKVADVVRRENRRGG
ncbi:MAG TPA: dihydropteroate synthase [Terriglobales bacterium]|nr:dihydropteroate synthase [Terriglobales bacterium]